MIIFLVQEQCFALFPFSLINNHGDENEANTKIWFDVTSQSKDDLCSSFFLGGGGGGGMV